MITQSIFKEYDIRGRYPEEITDEAARRIALAVAKVLRAKRIVIGRDRRTESAKLVAVIGPALAAAGIQVLDVGVTSTPAVFLATLAQRADAGIMATASHNPVGYAGMKIADRTGLTMGMKTGLKKIMAEAMKVSKIRKTTLSVVKRPLSGAIKSISANADYYRWLTKQINPKDLIGIKAVLDIRHGSGGDLAHYVFSRLPLKSSEINAEVSNRLSPHGFNPLISSNWPGLRKAVKAQKADLGIMWDGDADRCVLFDEQGKFVHPYYANCLLAQIIFDRQPGAKMAVDARLPVGISRVIRRAGGKPLVVRSGYANIIASMQRSGAIVGCENSAHYFFTTKIVGNKSVVIGDALVAPLLIAAYLKKTKQKLSTVIAELSQEIVISGEINIEGVDSAKVIKTLTKKYKQYRQTSLDGLSVYGPDWFFNLRSSKTEPLVRLNIEAGDKKTVGKLKKELVAVIKG